VSRLGEGAEIMVIEAGMQPRVVAALGRDRDAALSAIGSAEAHDLPNRVIDAIRTARALVGTDARAEIHVFTDGAYALASTPETTDPRVRWTQVARGGRNVAITSLAVRKNYFGSFDYQAFASLVNYTGESQTFDFVLTVEGQTIAEKSVTLEPNVRRSLVLPFSHTGGGSVVARAKVDDDLAADNVAYAVLPPPRKISVLLVSRATCSWRKSSRPIPR
jgi:hypothetical protein